jgi:hypothetical protein
MPSFTLLARLTLMCSLASAPLAALADCEALTGGIDYKLLNRWTEKDSRREVKFKPLCADHAACYTELGRLRRECDTELEDALKAICEKIFRRGTRAKKRCDGRRKNALEVVKTRGTSVYLRAQSKARTAARRAQYQSVTANRKASSKQRREQRRKDAYRRIYEQLQGTAPQQ